MLVPNYIPPSANPWFIQANTIGSSYPSGIKNQDIVILLEADSNTFDNAPGFTTLTTKEYTTVTGSGTEQDPYVTNYLGKARVSWRTNAASKSGASIGGDSEARRLIVLRRPLDGGGSSHLSTHNTTTGSSFNYTHDFSGLNFQYPVLPIFTMCQAASVLGNISNTKIGGMNATGRTRGVSRAHASLFIPDNPELFVYPQSTQYQGSADQIVTWKAHIIRKI